jgi:hypothetical protein
MSLALPAIPELLAALRSGTYDEQQSALDTLGQLVSDASHAQSFADTPGALPALFSLLEKSEGLNHEKAAVILLWLLHHEVLGLTGLAAVPGLVVGMVAAARFGPYCCHLVGSAPVAGLVAAARSPQNNNRTAHVTALTILAALATDPSNKKLLGQNDAVLAALGFNLCQGPDNAEAQLQVARALSSLATHADIAQYIIETTDVIAWLTWILKSPRNPASDAESAASEAAESAASEARQPSSALPPAQWKTGATWCGTKGYSLHW